MYKKKLDQQKLTCLFNFKSDTSFFLVLLTNVSKTLFINFKLKNDFFLKIKYYSFQCIKYTNYYKNLSFKIPREYPRAFVRISQINNKT